MLIGMLGRRVGENGQSVTMKRAAGALAWLAALSLLFCCVAGLSAQPSLPAGLSAQPSSLSMHISCPEVVIEGTGMAAVTEVAFTSGIESGRWTESLPRQHYYIKLKLNKGQTWGVAGQDLVAKLTTSGGVTDVKIASLVADDTALIRPSPVTVAENAATLRITGNMLAPYVAPFKNPRLDYTKMKNFVLPLGTTGRVSLRFSHRLFHTYNYTSTAESNNTLVLTLAKGSKWASLGPQAGAFQDIYIEALLFESDSSQGPLVLGLLPATCVGSDDGTGAGCALSGNTQACAVQGGNCVYRGLVNTVPAGVKVARIVKSPTISVTHTVIHPTTPSITIHGTGLDADDVAIEFANGLQQDIDYTMAPVTPAGTEIKLTLVDTLTTPTKGWLRGNYGSRPLQITKISAHRGTWEVAVEVAVVLQACVPPAEGSGTPNECANANNFQAGFFICDWANRRLKQLAGLNFETETLNMSHFSSMNPSSSLVQDPRGLLLDRASATVYISHGMAKGSNPQDPLILNNKQDSLKACGKIARYHTKRYIAGPQVYPALPDKKVRGPVALALHEVNPITLRFQVWANFWGPLGFYAPAHIKEQYDRALTSDLALILGLPFDRIRDLWGSPGKGRWVNEPSKGNQDVITFSFTAVGVETHQVDSFISLLQADIRNAAGVLNSHTNHSHFQNPDGTDMLDPQREAGTPSRVGYYYKGRVHNPEVIIYGEPSVEGTPPELPRSLRRKFLYVASNEMNCVVRYRFVDPANPTSSIELAPRAWDPYWEQPLHLSPFTCNPVGKCLNRTTESPWLRPSRPGEGASYTALKKRIRPAPKWEDMPATWTSLPKQCIGHDQSSKECDPCSKHDDCLVRDSEICWSPIGGHLEGSSHVEWSPADPEIVYVGVGELGKVVQLNATTGEVVQVSYTAGRFTTGLGIESRRLDFGVCKDSDGDLEPSCTGQGGTTEGETMPPGRRVPCSSDAECHPDEIVALYQAVSDPARGCEHQAILKQVNQTDTTRETEPGQPHRVLASESPGRFKARFAGWIKDRSLQHPSSLQFHNELGILVSEGSRVLRYDATTGNLLQTLVDIGHAYTNTQTEEKNTEPGEITCLHAE